MSAAHALPIAAAPSDERLVKSAIVLAMIAFTVLDRFGLRISADYAIPPALVALYAVAAALILAGAAAVDLRGAAVFAALAGIGAASYLVNAASDPAPFVTLSSLLLLFAVYAPFVVRIRPGALSSDLWAWSARTYVTFALLVAVAGIAQFLAQFAFQAQWLFDYTPLLPEALRASGGWNTAYSTGDWTKSNGFFLREPSIFSVAMALGIICELAGARRKWALAIMALGLVLSYSGSGLLCLGLALLFPLRRGLALRLAAVAVLIGAAYLAVGEALNLSYTLGRAGEIVHEGTSAHCRFVYPGAVALRELDSSPWASLLGHGPGTMVRMGATCADGHQTTYAKVLFEYGLAGALALAAFLLFALGRGPAPLQLRIALGVTWLLLGGNLLDPAVVLLIYVLSAMWPDREGA